LSQLLDQVAEWPADTSHSPATRRDVLQLLQSDRRQAPLESLSLEIDDDTGLRAYAVTLAARGADREYWATLWERFAGESPALRSAVVSAALARSDATDWLLDEIETGRIRAAELGRTDLDRLQHIAIGPFFLRERAARILAAVEPEDRRQALTRYEPCLEMQGDAPRGRALFARHCAACHRIGDVGVDVAPDIADSRTKTLQQLLVDIVQPNSAIDGNYISYLVQTHDGRTFTGVISTETATSVTFRQAENKTETLARTDIASLRSTGVSLMPEGLEQNLSLQDMADLLSFIKNWRYLDGRIPLNP
jgi:putative heme-binding domain-containing protein